MINFRKAEISDKERIFEISSQIWDGDDYINVVFDEWVKATDGEFTVAEENGLVAGFAKYSRFNEKEVWLEGIRVDGKYANKGIGSCMTGYLLEKAAKEAAETVRLSTFIDNVESIRIIEKYGFKKDGYFTYCEKELKDIKEAKPESSIVNIMSTSTAWELITKRNNYMMSNGYISFGWQFKKINYELIDSLVKEKKVYGVLGEGSISSILILAEDSHKDGGMCVSFLDGSVSNMKRLLDFALYETKRRAAKQLSIMAPLYDNMIDALELCEFSFLHDKPREVNVFIYSKEV